MKTHLLAILISLVATLVTAQEAKATIWRVNNKGFSAQFTTLQAANNSNLVQSGDTIHLEASTDNYDGTTINKKLIIIGAGYLLTENPRLSGTMLESSIAGLAFTSGSEGSRLMSVRVYGSVGIVIRASNITIKQCRIDVDLTISGGISDIFIYQNFFSGRSNNTVITTGSAGFAANVVFNNNICFRTLLLPDNYTMQECKNNVFDSPAIANQPSIKLTVGSFQNNILKNANANVSINGGSNLNVSFNVGGSPNQFGTANNNIVVSDFNQLFVDSATNSTDGDYQLRPNSAASGNGSDGTDRGAFGGEAITNRYKLSGISTVPVIYEINTSGVAGPAGLIVNMKARTVN